MVTCPGFCFIKPELGNPSVFPSKIPSSEFRVKFCARKYTRKKHLEFRARNYTRKNTRISELGFYETEACSFIAVPFVPVYRIKPNDREPARAQFKMGF